MKYNRDYILEEFRTLPLREVGWVFRGGDDIHVALFVCRSEGFRCPGQKPNA